MSPSSSLPARIVRSLLVTGGLALACSSTACDALVGVEDVRHSEAGEIGGAPACLRCDGQCVPAQTNEHCGACGVACGAGQSCLAGVCDRSMRGGAGARTVCLRDSQGVLRCRGANDRGQLGRGTVSEAEPSWEPPLLGGAAVSFAVGSGDASCFLLTTGRVLCSGTNERGALGSAAPGDDGEPSPATDPLAPARDLSAGPTSETAAPICVIEEPTGLRCWGLAAASAGDHTLSLTVPGPALVRVETGGGFVCVLDQAGKIQCVGVVGERTLSASAGLRAVEAPPARAIAAGALAMCLLDDDGVVWCWGGNRFGQLGAGAASDRTTAVPLPVGVGFPLPMRQIVGGDVHFCALEQGGGVVCWGSAVGIGDGLGTGLPCAEGPCRVLPERVPIADIVELAAAQSVTFARRSDGAIFAWGTSSAADCLLGPRCEDVTYLLPTRIDLP